MNLQEEVARLAHENASLRELNTALKQGNAALNDANSALKDANAALNELVTSIRGGTLGEDKQRKLDLGSTVAGEQRPTRTGTQPTESSHGGLSRDTGRLPQELLLRIFLATIPPDDCHDISIVAGPRSEWLLSVSTRRALASVCKTWHDPATKSLYADIALRRMGQISALARTLRSGRLVYSAPDRSKLIKRIRLVQSLVLAPCADIVKADLITVLQHCTRLSAFEYQLGSYQDERLISPSPDDPEQWYDPMWLSDTHGDTPVNALAKRCASGLQHLTLTQEMDQHEIEYMHRLLKKGTHLQTVRLGPISADLDTETTWFRALPSLKPITLAHLRSLEVHCTLLDLEDYVRNTWRFPSLKELTVLDCDTAPLRALQQLGQSLEYLHILPSDEWTDEDVGPVLAKLHALCPSIKHIVLPHISTLDLLPVIVSPTLQYLDIWAPAQKRRVVELMCEMGRESSIPALRGVRMLPPALRYLAAPHSARLPLICDPSTVSGEEVRLLTLPGVMVLQTSWAVFPDVGGNTGDPVGFCGASDDEDTQSGSDFVPMDCEWEDEREDEDEDEVEDEDEGADEEESNDGSKSQASESQTALDDTFDGTLDDSESETASEHQWTREEVLDRYARGQEEDFLLDSDDD
ncbi:hypothetical protein C2E23DRAFT_229462 [Lenzites betulinus]|nr:hypothetical protein C2E23DRAFT_229462 [Lenzites betulinus]